MAYQFQIILTLLLYLNFDYLTINCLNQCKTFAEKNKNIFSLNIHCENLISCLVF